ncbi:DNA-binding protein [Pseudomonas sp.]|uniref:DNA-binding protein n=1 Tax=Pseudomonas sp. TaxID=306 RepID=UPI003D0D0120
MPETLSERALLLINATSLTELSKAGTTDYPRWVNIKRGRARVGADEIEILGALYPQHRWWLMTGEVMLEMGQNRPDYSQK